MNSLLKSLTDFVNKQPLVVAAAALVVGILFGWLAIGWGLWPVDFVNGNIAQLAPQYQQDYVRLVAAEYVLDPDLDRAAERIDQLGPAAATVISDTLSMTQGEEAIRVAQLQQVLVLSGRLGGAETPAGEGEQSLLQRYQLPLLLCSLVIVFGLIGLGGFYLWSTGAFGRGGSAGGARASRPAAATAATRAGLGATPAAARADPAATLVAGTGTRGAAVAQFMTTYVLGDDLYDDSFSIDGPDGSFLGECGMGISETIGVGDPKKVMAFEVWLFDKNDIRTVTKVLMSDHAFRDEALKSRLAAKGEPVLLTPGDTVSLETASLVVTARVVDMAYGGGALPPSSFFERLTIELAAFTKV
jgi:hypothetical protein